MSEEVLTEKESLILHAEAMGIEVGSRDTIADLKEKIAGHEEAVADANRVPVADLEEASQALFGQPRSVFVGAKSAGFISGERVSKEEAAEGIQRFLNYTPGGK